MAYFQIPYDRLFALCQDIFSCFGFSPEESKCITDSLLAADLSGVESHGVQRMYRYYGDLKRGYALKDAKPEIIKETPVSAVIDAHRAMGQLISCDAMALAIKKAKETGIGMVAVRNSNHYGIAGYYAEMASKEDLMGLCMTNTGANMIPTGGKRPMLGTNPIAVSMPADPVPFLFDAATTVVARGKIEVYNKKGAPLPVGYALDENGNDCTDADVALKLIGSTMSGILPIGGRGELTGGHKGFGLGLLVELCTGVLSGGITSNKNVANLQNPVAIPTAHFFGAMDYGLFGDKAEIKDHFSRYLNEIRESPKADGETRIFIAGEKEAEARVDRLQNGILVNDKTASELKQIAEECGVPYGDLFE